MGKPDPANNCGEKGRKVVQDSLNDFFNQQQEHWDSNCGHKSRTAWAPLLTWNR